MMDPIHASACEVAALKELMLAMFAARDRAANTATTSMNERLLGMNEFRNALRDQTAAYITRDDHERLVNRVNEVRDGQLARVTVSEFETFKGTSSERLEFYKAAVDERIRSCERLIYLGLGAVTLLGTIVQIIVSYHLIHI